MLPFGVTIQATVPQGSEFPEGLMNNPVYIYVHTFIDSIRVKQSRNRPDVAQSVPGGLGSQIFMTFGT